MTENTESERRTNSRIAFVTEVDISGFGVRRSTDLSRGGIYLEAVTTFPVDTLLRLRFKLDQADDDMIEVRGKVLYAHDTIGFGLLFTDLKPEDQQRIDELITSRLGPAE